ncbi:AAA family ATPase [Bradyrhizobium sp. 157]|uniref:ATP-dependent nuclease n=1 Tax=Bradyrhizobium sp. 157 TaxID=2782631 RepID=UPI001FF8BD5D|nr:ATP-binding protein [Bradyrhizobium sp. 157]MCK1639132.1 AAA family ATPase [Bradyrhizobium sp. 157]
MFTSAKFRNFKSLREFTVPLRRVNILVGPNNAGKSSVLDAFRALSAAQTFASRRNPSPINVGRETVFGYEIPRSLIPISLDNIHSDYDSDRETSATFELANGNRLKLQFLNNSRCILTAETTGKQVQNTSGYKRNYPISIALFPTLGPLEEEEDLVDPNYLRRWQTTRRSNRLFRNIWYQRNERFAEFKTLVEDTWPGMTISPPERQGFTPPRLSMFCTEARVDREVSWAGFGFQVWLQLLTHFLGARDATTMVVDEPEIYLHPDLQRRLFLLLRSSGKQLIMATHSSEIVNEAEHEDILLISRTKKFARRIGDIEGLQEALFTIGSGQNIHLARLSRGRKILFFEGDDIRLMKKFAARQGLRNFENETNVTVVPLGGFSHREKIADAAWTFEKVLRAEIAIAAVLDRDYRCPEEIDQIRGSVPQSIPNFFILDRKELENYLLDPAAITCAINDRLGSQPNRSRSDLTLAEVESILNTIADNSKSILLSQIAAHRVRFFEGRTRNDASTVFNEAIAYLDSRWTFISDKLAVVPGKQFLSSLNTYLQYDLGISITATQILRHLVLPPTCDLRAILIALDAFSATNRA